MRLGRVFLLTLGILAVILPLPARAGGDGPEAAAGSGGPATPPAASSGEFRIGPEDRLQITVWKNEALSREVPVRPDGMITLPLLNDVRAAGLTPMQLRAALAERLAVYMPDPEVSVIVLEVHSPKVSVLGEVAHPGRFTLTGRTTVLDLLAQAGGLSEFAARSRIVVLRRRGPGMVRLRFDYDKALADGAVENFDLEPGDIVMVR